MRQYKAFKEQYPDYVLLFRMGDFYETFYEDAKLVSRVLGLALTARSKGPSAVPLAGVPYHALDAYLARLVKAGHRVAICEQVENPKLAQGLVKRDVVRLVTPGTITEQELLEQKQSNYLAAVFVSGAGAGAVGVAGLRPARDAGVSPAISPTPTTTNRGPEAHGTRGPDVRDTHGQDAHATRGRDARATKGAPAGLAWVELSSGAFCAMVLPADGVMDELVRLGPAEVIFPEDSSLDSPAWRQNLRQVCNAAATSRPPWAFDAQSSAEALRQHFQAATLEGFGFPGWDESISAAGAIIDYLRETQKTALAHIRALKRFDRGDFMAIDGSTLRSLEVHRTLRTHQRAGSLLTCVDRTATGMGARLLERWLTFPLTRYSDIVARQDAVEELASDAKRLERIRAVLADTAQVDRIASSVVMNRVRPRDLVALGNTFRLLPELAGLLDKCSADLLTCLGPLLAGLEEPADLIARAIRPQCPSILREGGVIAEGYHEDLDRLRRIGHDGQSWLSTYQAQQSRRVGIPNLKVGYNKVFGYYIEITNVHADKVPADYVRKQTLTNAERYITDELKRYETEALTAGERAKALEGEIFEQVRLALAGHIAAMQRAADALANLDVLAGLAQLVVERGYRRPTITQDNVLHIVGGRHPVLAEQLREQFVPNDVHMEAADDRLLIITGPNMSGKSTYIRQTALLVLLAQTGSFIPAEEATIGLADRIYTRVGAADELARGLSTFMLEMVETANILNSATARSLVILDEVGRGTSTTDGLALAWAVCEHLALRLRCRTLFATHYHELTQLESVLDGTKNLNVAVREWGDQVIFLHKIVEGGTDRSYGLHVARLAGVPKDVIDRARAILPQVQAHLADSLDMPDLAARARAAAAQLQLFADPAARAAREIQAADLDNLTPLQALELLRRLKSEL